jgi:hypothetical protein
MTTALRRQVSNGRKGRLVGSTRPTYA